MSEIWMRFSQFCHVILSPEHCKMVTEMSASPI